MEGLGASVLLALATALDGAITLHFPELSGKQKDVGKLVKSLDDSALGTIWASMGVNDEGEDLCRIMSSLTARKGWRYPYSYRNLPPLFPRQNSRGEIVVDWDGVAFNVREILDVVSAIASVRLHDKVYGQIGPSRSIGAYSPLVPGCSHATTDERHADHVMGILLAKYEVEEYLSRVVALSHKRGRRGGDIRGAASISYGLSHLALESSMKLAGHSRKRTHKVSDLVSRIDFDPFRERYSHDIRKLLTDLEVRQWSGKDIDFKAVYRSVKECADVEDLLDRVDRVRELLYSYNPDVLRVQPFVVTIGGQVCMGVRRENTPDELIPMAALDGIVTSLVKPYMSPVSWERLNKNYEAYAGFDMDEFVRSTPDHLGPRWSQVHIIQKS